MKRPDTDRWTERHRQIGCEFVCKEYGDTREGTEVPRSDFFAKLAAYVELLEPKWTGRDVMDVIQALLSRGVLTRVGNDLRIHPGRLPRWG